MKTQVEKTTIKGGWVKRDAKSGRLISVGHGEKVSRASEKTRAAVERVASQDDEALKRLANR